MNKTNTTNSAAREAGHKTFRVVYFSGRSRKIVAVNYDEAVLLAHRGRQRNDVADITEIL